MKAVKIEFSALKIRGTWKIIDQNDNQIIKSISLKWIFIYKINNNEFLKKDKIHLIIKDDFQKFNI